MSLVAVNEHSLRAIVDSTMTAAEKRSVLALQALPLWDGPSTIATSGRTVHVRVAASPLAVREVMRQTLGDGELLVLLTPLDGAALGLDVCVRVAKGKVVRADIASSARSILGVAGFEPALADERWLLDELASIVINDQHSLIVRGLVLDLNTAWQVWMRHRLGVATEPTTAGELLALFIAPTTQVKMPMLADPIGRAFERRYAALKLPTGVLVSLTQQRLANDLVPYGLVLDVVSSTKADEPLRARQQIARIRLESTFGRSALDVDQERVWADAAIELASGADSERSQQWRTRASEILTELDVAPLGSLSGMLRGGLEHGLAQTAALVQAQWSALSVDRSAIQQAADQLLALQRHPDADTQSVSLAVIGAALRLTQRRAAGLGAAVDIFEQVELYRSDLAWVDRCRAVLIDGGAGPHIEALAQRVLEDIDTQRRAFDVAFAHSFAQWSGPTVATETVTVIPIERTLDTVVAPVASIVPTLLVVLDGAGIAVLTNLFGSLRSGGWTLLGHGSPASMVVAASALPSVTECSRASLLAGALVKGVAADEKRSFSSHRALRLIAPTSTPILFHKAELAGPDGSALAPIVLDAISNTQQRIVGVVVNAIDDHLSGGSQIVVGWNVADIRHLAQLLDCARDAGRAVVITADHGHVLDAGRSMSRATLAAERGDRWRAAYEPAGDGEIEVQGARVVGGGGRVVLPFDDRVRYGGKKHGYHGGLTPQEVLVPVAVFVPSGVAIAGWTPVESIEPTWWEFGALPPLTIDAEPVVSPAVANGAPAVAKRTGAKGTPVVPQLFEPEANTDAAATQIDWVAQLFAAPLFIGQREAAARQPIDDNRVRTLLRALRNSGFTLTRDALGLAVGGQPATLRGEINTMRRLLNVDGYEVFAVEGDTLAINVELLATQFGISAVDIRGAS
jgi:PglZ domain